MDSNDRRKWFDKLFKGKKDDKPKPYQRPPVPPGYEEFWIGPIPFRRRKKTKRRPKPTRATKSKQKRGCLRDPGCWLVWLKLLQAIVDPYATHSSNPYIEQEKDN